MFRVAGFVTHQEALLTRRLVVARVVARFSNILDDLTAVKGKKITVTSPDEVLSTQSERLLP